MTGESLALKVMVVGEESVANLRLADMLRQILGKENVYRCLELGHVFDFLNNNRQHPLILFLDLFAYDLSAATHFIDGIRSRYPAVVFNLYMDRGEYKSRWSELPPQWGTRLSHYFRTYKQSADAEFEPVVRLAIALAEGEMKRVAGESASQPGSQLPPHKAASGAAPVGNTIFVSYSRGDWDAFVADMVMSLSSSGYDIWVDQQFLIGGDDWMTRVGNALDQCRLLLLVVSPEALASKYVKMEYRYFINHDKTVVPVMFKPVTMPFELSGTQHIEFTSSTTAQAFAKLRAVLDHHLKEQSS